MGMNISIYDERTSCEIPCSEWDTLRYAGDSEVPKWLSGNTIEKIILGEPAYRPINFETAYSAAQASPNPDRHAQMLKLLEENPTYWLAFSY